MLQRSLKQIWISNNKQSYQQVNCGQGVMAKKKDIEIKVDSEDVDICQLACMMDHGQDHYSHPSNSHRISSYINAILHPPSIFKTNNTQPALDHYFKIKPNHKFKDTLDCIREQKQAFISYVQQPHPHHDLPNTHPLQNHINQSTRIKQIFPQFTFYNCKKNTLLFAKISPSRTHKCNISIANLRGEVVKYYPNIILSKKEGKIIKFLSENSHPFLFVFDYTQISDTICKFPSLINESHLLYYRMVNMDSIHHGLLAQIKQKVQISQKGLVALQANSIVLISKRICSVNMRKVVQKVCQRIVNVQIQQKIFLSQIRGIKKQIECIFPFDMMMVDVWKKYNLQGKMLLNKIIQLFELKESSVFEMIKMQIPTHHAPKIVKEFQNCCFCLSAHPQIQRQKRTRRICTKCSSEQEKYIYLCKECFKLYHKENDLFAKIQKKGRKRIKRVPRKLVNQFDNEQAEERPTENQMILLKLDKKCDEFFSKIDQLIDQGSFASTEYYLTMLMNMTILQTHKYLSKFEKKQGANIKMQPQ